MLTEKANKPLYPMDPKTYNDFIIGFDPRHRHQKLDTNHDTSEYIMVGVQFLVIVPVYKGFPMLFYNTNSITIWKCSQ